MLLAEFQEWKIGEEEATQSSYIKVRRGKQQATRTITNVYYCHRRGHYHSKGKALRQLKVQGSCKINGICPASLVVKTELSGNFTSVECLNYINLCNFRMLTSFQCIYFLMYYFNVL